MNTINNLDGNEINAPSNLKERVMSVIARRSQKQRLFVGASSVLVLASLLSFSFAVPGEASNKVSTTGSYKQKTATVSTATTVPVSQETVVVANETNADKTKSDKNDVEPDVANAIPVDKDGDGTIDYYKVPVDKDGDGIVDYYKKGYDTDGDGVVDSYSRDGKDNCGGQWSKHKNKDAKPSVSGSSDHRRDWKHQQGSQFKSGKRSDGKHHGEGHSRSGHGGRHGGGKYGK